MTNSESISVVTSSTPAPSITPTAMTVTLSGTSTEKSTTLYLYNAAVSPRKQLGSTTSNASGEWTFSNQSLSFGETVALVVSDASS